MHGFDCEAEKEERSKGRNPTEGLQGNDGCPACLPMETAVEEACQKAEMIRTATKNLGAPEGETTPR